VLPRAAVEVLGTTEKTVCAVARGDASSATAQVAKAAVHPLSTIFISGDLHRTVIRRFFRNALENNYTPVCCAVIQCQKKCNPDAVRGVKKSDAGAAVLANFESATLHGLLKT